MTVVNERNVIFMKEIFDNLTKSMSKQNIIDSDTFRLCIHGYIPFVAPIDNYLDDGLVLISELINRNGSTWLYYSVLEVECGKIHKYNDIPHIYGFNLTLEYMIMVASGEDITKLVLFGENAYYYNIERK